MKKVTVLVSTFVLFACLTFAQTPQTQDKSKAPEKKECTMKKDGKSCSKDKAGCCSKKGTETKDTKTTKTPEKK